MASSSSNLTASSAHSASPPTSLTVDQLILSALISSLSENILAHVVKCSTSRDVWLTLERMFTSHTCARIMFMNLADTLAVVDHPLNDVEMISFLLAGLGSEYDSFVTSVNTHVEPLSLEDLASQIMVAVVVDSPPHLKQVATLLQANAPTVAVWSWSLAMAQMARPICQVCGKLGHIALTCYHRFDNSYATKGNSNMQALLATPQPQYDNNWYSDTGATHHLTSDLSNLNVCADEYTSTEQIRVGSGNTENTASRAE
uniref:CCHC-type domain-containing protein n=1 Tax=Fagus sylvatica TaxID=28930 RepID=A0A2N9FJE8_FAGSY